jgi:hypothetical protein
MAQSGEEYAARHVSHALMEALIAAATWACSRDGDERGLPYKIQEIAEYSAFAHQRGLFELFCDPGANDKGELTVVGKARRKLGGDEAVESLVWDTWHEHLNRAAAHLAKRHEEIDPVVDGVHLKDQVVDFAREVVRIWTKYERASGISADVRARFEQGKAIAFTESDAVTVWFGYPPLDWLAEDPAAEWISAGLKWWPTESAWPEKGSPT